LTESGQKCRVLSEVAPPAYDSLGACGSGFHCKPMFHIELVMRYRGRELIEFFET
jgi:hypothetical protein